MSPSARTAASDVSDLESRYPYQYWISDEQCLILSKLILDGDDLSASNGILIKNPTTGAWVTTSTTTYYTLYTTTYSTGDFLRLYYNDVTGWEACLPDMVRRAITNTTIYYSAYGSGTLPSAVYTNGVSLPSPFVSGGSTLPSNIPPFDNVQEAINNALNASTGTTTQANQIQSTVNTNLDSYKNGDITSSDMQNVINTAVSDLETLNQNSTNTLADQIAINNALTATQTAQDQVLTNELIEAINDKFNWNVSLGDPISASELTMNFSAEVQNIYTDYKDGIINKNDAINQVNQLQNGLTLIKSSVIDSGAIWTEANEAVFQDLRELTQQTQNNINNAGDIDNSIADSFESSEQAEKDYLNDLTSETTASIQDISPKNEFTDSELGAASNIMQIIWENKFVKSLLVICGCFMVVCVVLGIRYKV